MTRLIRMTLESNLFNLFNNAVCLSPTLPIKVLPDPQWTTHQNLSDTIRAELRLIPSTAGRPRPRNPRVRAL